MIFPRSFLLVTLLAVTCTGLAANRDRDRDRDRGSKNGGKSEEDAPEPVPPPEMSEAEKAKVLEKVKKMQAEYDAMKREVTNSALSRYEGASASEGAALEFFLSCQKIIKDRTPDIETPEQDAKNAKADRAKLKQQMESYQEAPGRATALKTQLEYLVLTIQAPGLKDRGTLVSKVRDMVGKAMNVVKTYAAPNVDPVKRVAPIVSGKGRVKMPTAQYKDKEEERARRDITRTMKQGVMGTPFAEAYNLTNYFKPADNWSDSPLDLNGIYLNFVLPWYKENKRGDLNQVWDEYLGHELALHRCEQDDFAFATWGVTGYKNLLWKKWMDLLVYGMNRSLALDELAKMVKENPSHPDVENWINDLARVASEIRLPQIPQAADSTPDTPATNTEAAK